MSAPPTSPARRIAAAARALLVAEGSQAVTFDKVAAELGMDSAELARHYADRRALFDVIAHDEFVQLAGRWQTQRRTGDPDLDVQSSMAMLADFALETPRLYAFLFLEPRKGARTYASGMRAGRSPALNVVAEALREGMRQGVFRPDDEWELALLLAAQVHGFIQLHLGGRLHLTDDAFHALCRRSLARTLSGLRT